MGRKATIYATEFAPPPVDRSASELARQQHGVVALGQLLDLGLGASAVRTRVSAGRLHRVHNGVYSVGHSVLTFEGRAMAAVLACGHGAVLSHRSAAALWDLRQNAGARIEVTVPRRTGRRRPGIHVHRSRHLDPVDTSLVSGIPCTSVARTLLDLAEVVNRRSVERVCERAEMLRLYDGRAIDGLLRRTPTRRGAHVLRAVIAELRAGETMTRNDLEERFFALCDSGGIQRPQVNAWIDLRGGGVEADFLWRAERLIVETDGYESHGTRPAFESDRERDVRLQLAGWRVVRFTWRQIVRDPRGIARAVKALMAQASNPS